MVDDNYYQRPKFLPSYLGALKDSAERRDWRAIIPLWLIGSMLAGLIVAYFMPHKFWSEENLRISVAVYAGILTFNGLILALCWSVFSKIYEIVTTSPFSVYLKNKNLLNRYILYVSFVHGAQIFAVIVSGSGLLLVLLATGNTLIGQIMIAFAVAATTYGIKKAADAITAMHDLIWQKAIFDDNFNE